jgi:hypothetical protein
MEPPRDALAEFLETIDNDLEDGDVETARNRIGSFQEEYDLKVREGGTTIGVHIDIWSYDYNDDVYFIVRGYDSVTAGVEDVVAEHVHSLVCPTAERATECAARMRDEPPTVTEESYESTDTEIDIYIHADVYYHRINISCGETRSGQVNRPSEIEIVEAVESVIPDDEKV